MTRAVVAALAVCSLVSGGALRDSTNEDGDRRDIVTVAGMRLVDGQPSFVHVLGVGPDGRRVARELLADLGAVEVAEAPLRASVATSTLPPARWNLLGFTRATLPVVVEYNPANERVATEQSVRDALQLWNDVATSRLQFTFGGTTTACASLLGGSSQPGCPARSDGRNVVAWGFAPPGILGIMVGNATEGDILLNRTVPLTDQCPVDALTGYPLDVVVIHELGHMGGLDHASDPAQVMFPSATGSTCSLQSGDRDGATVLYPEAQSAVSGVVRHAATGTPIAGAAVAIRNAVTGGPTSATGSFEVTLPRSVVYDVTVTPRPGTGLEPAVQQWLVDDPAESVVVELPGATPIVAVPSTTPVREGDVGRFRVRLAAAVAMEAGVSYTIDLPEGPTQQGAFVFPPGATEHELDVPVPDDTVFESGEAVRLTLYDPVNASIATPQVLMDVRDDDDRTPPAVRCDARSPTFRLAQADARVSAMVADTESGPASTRISAAIDTSRVGARQATLTGRDRAGNARTVGCGYTVTYVYKGFLAPVDNPGVINVVDAGVAIPLRWQLLDARGRRVTNLTVARVTTVALACGSRPEDSLEEVALTGSALRGRRDGSYELAWRSPAGLAGSCRTLRLDLGEGIFRTAFFRFR